MRLCVIIPAWNREKNIIETVRALQNQDIYGTSDRVDFILIDDNSTDGTKHFLDVCDLPNKKVIHITNRTKWNASIPRNKGAIASSTSCDILYFLDSDVLLPPDRLRRLVEVYKADNDEDRVVIGPYHYMRHFISLKNNPKWYEGISDYSGDIRWNSFLEHDVSLKQQGIGFALACFGGSLAVPRKLFFKAGGFDETMLSGVEDGDFGLTLWETGAVFSLDKGLLGWHNPHEIVPERTQFIRECVDRLNKKHSVDIIHETGKVHRQWGIGEWTPPDSWIKDSGYTKEELL